MVLLLIVFFAYLMFLTFKWAHLKIDNVPVIVKVNDKIVYSGTSGCVYVKSSGDTTFVTINGGFLCLFPKEYYVGRGIKMEGKR
jgi:hypothetical protein